MPRVARNVFANIPHHITQRGNRREDVFFVDEDRQFYLERLGEYCEKWSVEILAYCLMTNHVHLILKPTSEDGLQRVLKPLHMRYAQRINKEKGWKGHLWQGRFFSSALDEAYLWSAIRYVERNPVRAKMVDSAEDYQWSSAACHCGLKEESLLAEISKSERLVDQKSWSNWLKIADSPSHMELLRRNVDKGLPCGSDQFIDGLEEMSGKVLRFRPQGRPTKG